MNDAIKKITGFFSVFILSLILIPGVYGSLNETIPVPEVSAKDSAVVPKERTAKWWVRRHNSRLKIITNQKIVFIGDSITHGWEYSEFWQLLNKLYDNRITNLGFSSDHTQHVIWRLENGEYPAGINPEYVVLMIGTNNPQKPESIAAGIGKIIRIISKNSPDAKLILFSLLPCGSGSTDEISVKNKAVNEIIKNYDGRLNVTYADIENLYLEEDGSLKEELFTDKLHLSGAGYSIWMSKLIEIIE